MNKKKESKVVPNVRFKGFTDDWKQRKLGELGAITTGNTPSTSVSEYYSDDGMIWVTPTDISNNITYETEKKLSKLGQQVGRVVPKNTILITCIASIGKNTMLGKSGSFNQQINGLTPNEIRYVPYFLFTESTLWSAQMKKSAAAGTMQIVNRTEFSELKTWITTYEEQKKIGAYFANLDRFITLHQQKITLLTKLKKAMLEKMFPKKGTVIPEFRFNGFANAWEQRKLGELYQRNTERNENLIGYDKTISVATMSYKDDGNGASERSLSTYKVLRIGDIAFEGHTNKQFRFGRFVVNDIGTGIMSPRFSALRPLNEMPVNFWKQYIHSESVIRGILVKSTKAGTMMNELIIPEFLNQTIMVPSENEQAVIGQYFASLDNLITLHQRKLDMLKKLKSACLSEMFI